MKHSTAIRAAAAAGLASAAFFHWQNDLLQVCRYRLHRPLPRQVRPDAVPQLPALPERTIPMQGVPAGRWRSRRRIITAQPPLL